MIIPSSRKSWFRQCRFDNSERVCHHEAVMKPIPAIVLFSLVSSGTHAQTVSYRKQVAPILAASCNACHGGAQPQSGLTLANYSAILKGGRRGKALVAGNPKGSLLGQDVEGTKMPRKPIG